MARSRILELNIPERKQLRVRPIFQGVAQEQRRPAVGCGGHCP